MGVYTDLAREAREINPHLSGVDEEEENIGDVHISRIQIQSEEAAKKLSKPIGNYVTIEAPKLVYRDTKVFQSVAGLLSREISELLPKDPEDRPVLVVGLGNRGITADALGPRVVERLFVTRHITQQLPELIGQPMRSVAAVAPGVLGTTGIETLEMLRGLTERIQPCAVIAIDALASRRANRISTAIQLTNTGIHPGSGVGNHRLGLTKESLRIPVIALGVPTVVYASTITEDMIGLIAGKMGIAAHTKKMVQAAEQIISAQFGPMIVTPKEIDTIITDMANILSNALNMALHRPYFSQIEELLA